MSARVTTLVIRDPDWSNEYVEEIAGDVVTETIDVDLGSQFDGPKGFRGMPEDEQEEYVQGLRERVAHLPAGGPIRQAVEQLIDVLYDR